MEFEKTTVITKVTSKPTVEYIETIEEKGPRSTTFVSDDLGFSDHPVADYEGRHRYDPDFQWGPNEEKRVVRKLDWKVCTCVCLAFFCLLLDRSNTGQALSDNLLDDLHMNTNDYNLGGTIFNICFLIWDIPAQLIAKRIGPDRYLPMQMICWSAVAGSQAFLKGRNTYLACRALLGITEAGFIPANILYLSYFFTGPELAIRLMYFWVSYHISNIGSALMAYGILHMEGIGGLQGWRWLFGIEGLMTVCMGIIAVFVFPASPTQPSLYAKKKGTKAWFTEREEKILVNRLIRDDPSKGGMHNREHLTVRMVWKTLTDWHMFPMYLIGLTWTVPFTPMASYLTLQLRSMGFTTFQTNLLSIPGSILVLCQLMLWTWISGKSRQTFLLGLCTQVWAIPLLFALLFMAAPSHHHSHWNKWIVCTLLVGYPNLLAILTSIVSRNAGSIRTRTLASSIFNMAVHGASIIGLNIYRNDDKPLYHRGNKVLLCFVAWNIMLFLFAKWFYTSQNRKRDRIWNSMTEEEKIQYLTSTKDEGNKRLDFRFDS